MHASAFLHDIPRPIWIVATIMGFIWFWPVGLALLAYTVGSRRWGRRGYGGPGQWHNTDQQQQQGQQHGRGCGWARWSDWAGPWNQQQQQPPAPPSGNAAFDEYRAETLRRLEDEQKEFVEYLERLRRAKDKAEFDQFMADRRRPTIVPDNNPPS